MHSVNHGYFDRDPRDDYKPIIFDGEEIRLTHDELAQRRLAETETPAITTDPMSAEA